MGRESCRIIKNKFSTAPLCKEPSREKNAPITRNLCAVSNFRKKFLETTCYCPKSYPSKTVFIYSNHCYKKGARDSLTVSLAPKNENINQP